MPGTGGKQPQPRMQLNPEPRCPPAVRGPQDKVKELIGIKESDTGLSLPSQWDLVSDKQMMQEEQPLQVARCTKIINPGQEVRRRSRALQEPPGGGTGLASCSNSSGHDGLAARIGPKTLEATIHRQC